MLFGLSTCRRNLLKTPRRKRDMTVAVQTVMSVLGRSRRTQPQQLAYCLNCDKQLKKTVVRGKRMYPRNCPHCRFHKHGVQIYYFM